MTISDFDLGVDLSRRDFGRRFASKHGPECERGWDSFTPEQAAEEFSSRVLDSLSELWLAAYSLGFDDATSGLPYAQAPALKARLAELSLDISKLIVTPTAG
jgi:hypothetical protein